MSEYIPVRVKGSILFEYNPPKKLIRIKRGKQMHLIDLEAVEAEAAQRPEAITTAEALEVIKRI